MKEDNFDHLLANVRNEKVDEATVAEAGDRVWKMISGEESEGGIDVGALRSCADFQSLIPQYLHHRLASARSLLFEDHIHECVACRKELDRARHGDSQVIWQPRRENRRLSWQWALAGAFTLGVALALAYNLGVVPGQNETRGSVESVNGSVYQVSDGAVHIVPAGYRFAAGDEVRTAKESTAVLRLDDGSLVEMGERARVSVSRNWKGTTIHLDDGQVIVDAAKQRLGHLYVATDDCVVSAKGTVFSVNHGLKGSRVAVIEGAIRMDYGDNSADLRAGDEGTSSPNVSKVPINREIAWSKNSAKYLALLGDFAVLQKQLAAIPGPGLRYSSELLPYVPENTVIYAAIPNLSNTIGEATRLFHDRLQQSAALQEWWKQQQKPGEPKLDDMLDQFKTFNSFLGDEIVIAETKDAGAYSAPVILAKVRQSGLEAFLQSESMNLKSNRSQPALRVVHDPWSSISTSGGSLLVYLDNDLLIASPAQSELQKTVLRVKQGGGTFAGTPFYQQISHAYEQGAEWLFSADMEQIVKHNVSTDERGGNLPPGMADVRYLSMEHRDTGGQTETQAALTFNSERHGVASWLAAPASMGSLEFVSPDASMATSVVIKNPKEILEELFQTLGASDSNFNEKLAEFEAKSGVRVIDDIAAPLGGEVTMAFDGPLVPTPRWKIVFEVYDPVTLQATIGKLVESFNQENPERQLQLTKRQVGAQTYFAIVGSNQPGSEIDYSFVDGYLIVAPDTATISRAIQIRHSGFGLSQSQTFQALLPKDGYTNFSAIFYHNIGPVVGPLAEQLKSSGTLTAQQRQSIDALTANSAPGLIYAYGEQDRIVVASNTGFMGFDLGTLLTMGHNGPFLPQMMLGHPVTRSVPQTQ